MNSRTKVSVCLPVFNGAKYLAQAIESVLNQTYRNFELLISDDCSLDTSAEIIAEFARKDKRITFWRNPVNVGLFANYNQCIQRASGSLIKFFAQDDLLHEDMIERSVELLNEHRDVVLVSTDKIIIDSDGRKISPSETVPRPSDLFGISTKIQGPLMIRHCVLSLQNVIGEPSTVTIRRACAASGFDARFSHLGDLEFWLRVLLQGNYIFLPATLCSFRRHTASQSAINQRALLFLPDVLKFTRHFLPILGKASLSSGDEATDHLVLAMAQHVSRLAENDEIDPSAPLERESAIRAILGPRGERLLCDPDAVRLLDELIDFREMALRALCIIGTFKSPEIAVDSLSLQISRNEYRIDSLEERLHSILDSYSWRATRPLRELRRWLKTPGSAGASQSIDAVLPFLDITAFETPRQVLERQRKYIKYLRWQTRRVTGSASWKLTNLFRHRNHSSLSSTAISQRHRRTSAILPRHHMPQQSKYLSVAAVFRDDALYLKEWLEFHLLVGVEHFFLYDHLSTDNPMKVLKPYVEKGIVEVINWPFEVDGDSARWASIQEKAYADAIARAISISRWLAIIDIDEFLFPVTAATLPELLSDYEDFGGLCVNWHAFGTSAVTDLPPAQLLIETLTHCAAMDHPYNLHIKSIVQPARVTRCPSSHFCEYSSPYVQVNADKVSFAGRMAPYVSSDKVRINHYWTGAENDLYERKLPRSRNAGLDRSDALVQQRLRDFNACRSDGAILRFSPALRQRLGYDRTAPGGIKIAASRDSASG